MILGIEVALTLMGLYCLFTGRIPGKNSVSAPGVRWLGAFCITLLPVAAATVFCFSLIWFAMHAGLTVEQATERMRWPATGVEGAVAVMYVAVAIIWEKSIRRKLARDAIAADSTQADPQ